MAKRRAAAAGGGAGIAITRHGLQIGKLAYSFAITVVAALTLVTSSTSAHSTVSAIADNSPVVDENSKANAEFKGFLKKTIDSIREIVGDPALGKPASASPADDEQQSGSSIQEACPGLGTFDKDAKVDLVISFNAVQSQHRKEKKEEEEGSKESKAGGDDASDGDDKSSLLQLQERRRGRSLLRSVTSSTRRRSKDQSKDQSKDTAQNQNHNQNHLGLENNSEIKYLLRSAQANGLLDHIRNVYVVMDASSEEKYGAPRDLNFDLDNLILVKDTEMGVKKDYTWVSSKATRGVGRGIAKAWKRAALSSIPGLGDWFIYMPDDTFLVKQFHMAGVYDFGAKRPFSHSYGSWTDGWCDGGPTTGSGHGPVFFNKCAFKEIAKIYRKKWDDTIHPTWKTEAEANDNAVDTICLYHKQMLAQNAATEANDGGSSSFFFECHTNRENPCVVNAPNLPDAVFVNIQGAGVSDTEEDEGDEDWREWFRKQYPKKSGFEIDR